MPQFPYFKVPQWVAIPCVAVLLLAERMLWAWAFPPEPGTQLAFWGLLASLAVPAITSLFGKKKSSTNLPTLDPNQYDPQINAFEKNVEFPQGGQYNGLDFGRIPGGADALSSVLAPRDYSFTPTQGGTTGRTTQQSAIDNLNLLLKNLGGEDVTGPLRGALDTLNPATSYYKTALSGSYGGLTDLVAPEVSTVLAQYNNASKAAQESAPRGGGRTAALSELPFQQIAAEGNAINTARTGAAQNLTQAAGTQGSIASALVQALLGKYAQQAGIAERVGNLGTSIVGQEESARQASQSAELGLRQLQSSDLNTTGALLGQLIGTDTSARLQQQGINLQALANYLGFKTGATSANTGVSQAQTYANQVNNQQWGNLGAGLGDLLTLLLNNKGGGSINPSQVNSLPFGGLGVIKS